MRMLSNKMFVRMLAFHCDQNNSYEITLNGFQVRRINEIRNVTFRGKTSLNHPLLNRVQYINVAEAKVHANPN